MWVEKYRPKKMEEMIGNEDCRVAASVWLKKWKPGGKAMLLMGPPGTGKTTLANLLAKQFRMNIVELNASDTRTKDKLEKKIGEAILTVSLFGERSLIFLDEVDGLLGRSDYGGVEFIKEAVKVTQNPIIMAANDQDADEIKKLGSSCIALTFKPPPPRQVEMYLRRIARLEKSKASDEDIVAFVSSAGGDLRHAINSLQSGNTVASGGFKDKASPIAQGFEAFFDSKDPVTALAALRGISLSPIERVRELYRCLVRSNLSPDKLSEALGVLSEADMLMGKIMKNQEWRLLRYLDNMIAYKLLPVIRGQNVRYATDDLPFTTLLRIWNDSKKVKEISLKYARRSSTSGWSARSQDLPFLFALCGEKGFREELEKTLDLDETYEKFLQKEATR
ncbi:MAG: AAA family ATPase [Thaumarchaeota archaeon]|nr:AAA family ATPase [Nitrososphaerota archaeon]